MTDKRQQDEIRRREAAQRAKGQVVEGSGEEATPRRLDQMISVRLDPEILSGLRSLADETGRSVSDLVRAAAASMVAHRYMSPISVTIDSVSSLPHPGLATHEVKTFAGVVEKTPAELEKLFEEV
jgi:hypothetical protein